jgi:HPt (histidine-containing phosphotransfer) domain-containing protein
MSSASDTASSPGPLDPGAIQRLRDLDPTGSSKLLARLVAAYASSLDKLLPELAAARASVPLDLVIVRQVSHTLKSASASLGATALSARCAQIESQARDGLHDGLVEHLDALLLEIDQVRVALDALV